MGQAFKSVVTVTPRACIWAAVMLLSVPARWLVAWIFAAVCHECFHCLAVLLAGKRIHSIRIDALGAQIQTDPLQPVLSAICALAGPFAGVCLLLLTRIAPCVSLCAIVQSAFNLLPIYPLDGSVALRGVLTLLCSDPTANRICMYLEILAIFFLVVLCCYAAFIWKLGILPLVFAGVFLLRMKKRKIPCKCALNRVQ